MTSPLGIPRPPVPKPSPGAAVLPDPDPTEPSPAGPLSTDPAANPADPRPVPPAELRLGPVAANRCRRRIHLDAAHRGAPTTPNAATRRAFDELAEHRDRVFGGIRTANPELPPWAGTGEAWRTDQPALVLAPDMTTRTRSGRADLLVWAGDGYLPVIIRGHRTREPGSGAQCSALSTPMAVHADQGLRARRSRADRLALAHHYRQLQELGCASALARGGVIGRGSFTDGAGRADLIGSEDDAAVIVWHELDVVGSSVLADYDRRFGDRLVVAIAAATGGPALASPSRIVECRRCPWWPRCSAELTAAADISLLLTGADVAAARAAGITTITQLASLPKAALATVSLTVTSPSQAQIRARAWVRGVPLVRVGPGASIRRADVEIDVDAESYGEDGAYLWGAALSGVDVGMPPGYRAFVTWAQLPSAEQGTVFGEFFGYLMQVRAAAAGRGLSFGVFCYAKSAEERWMLGLARRYAGRPGLPAVGQVAAFCASADWVDVLQEIKRQFVPRGSLKLKELAGAMGFHWRDPEPGGENSMAWYRAAVDAPSTQHGAEMAQRVLRYNEDDVLATLAVRRWVNEHHADLPTVAELSGDVSAGPA
ncbi:MAG: TM0106 family RecB-like putative nuclease [Nakamurella sp.]